MSDTTPMTISESELNSFVNQAANLRPVASTNPADNVVEESEATKNSELNLDDDAPIIVGATTSDVEDEDIEKSITEIIAEQMIDMKNSNINDYNSSSAALVTEIVQFRKQLMIKDGLTATEADEAARNRARRRAQDTNINYMEEHPNLAIVKVDKTNADKLEFTPEEKAKITKAKAIKLVEVTDETLRTVKIKKSGDEKYKYDAVHRATCNVSKYELPLVNTFDSAQFAGSQTIQLVNAVYDENDSEYAKATKQLALAYDRFMGSTCIDKYDAEGNVIFSQEDFANWLAYSDLETAIYAIYVASSTETITSTFECDNESNAEDKEFKMAYSTKSLINYDDISDDFKQDINDILSLAKDNDANAMREIKTDKRITKRVKSTFTNNIYDLSSASCARALSILRWVNSKDPIIGYIAPFAIMTERVLVYDPTDDSYIEISAMENPKELLLFYRDMVEKELNLLAAQMNPLIYIPKFKLTTVCPKCGKKEERPFRVESLVFLKIQSTEEEIL